MRILTNGSSNKISPDVRFYNGFTLIEITVVLFIVGLLFFTAMPRLGNFLFQSDLKDVARSLKATVHLLRSKSIITHKQTYLHFDLDRNIYWGSFDSSDREHDKPLDKSLLTPIRELPKGIKFMDVYNINSSKKKFGLLTSSFNPKGIIEETILHLMDTNNRMLTIIINAYTCRFLLYDEYVDVEYTADRGS